MDDVNYAGFWIRTGAAIIDSILIMLVIGSLMSFMFGASLEPDTPLPQLLLRFSLELGLGAFAIILFWVYRAATPGKMMLKLIIVDARTGGKPSTGQLIGRYLAYYVSILPFMLGIIWVGLDKRKQGWHDKLAGTVVIRVNTTREAPVKREPADP